jgi:hypothetical protein
MRPGSEGRGVMVAVVIGEGVFTGVVVVVGEGVSAGVTVASGMGEEVFAGREVKVGVDC